MEAKDEIALMRTYSNTPSDTPSETNIPTKDTVSAAAAAVPERAPLAALDKVAIPTRSDLPDIIEYVLNCFAEQQKSKKLILVSKIVELDSKIQKLGFLFDLYDNLTLSQARQLITGVVSSFLTTINTSEKLKTYLGNTPFTEKEVSIRVRMRSKQCGFIYPELGNIAYVSAMEGNIFYDTLNSITYDIDNLRIETYKKALEITGS